MDIKQLRYFVGVASAGSVTEAAARLRVAQPALSQQILKLERDLGERLMLRHARGISLTQAGERLLAHATHILDLVEQAQSDVAGLTGPPRGPVRVGMPHSATDLMALEVLRRARKRYPDLRITVIDRMSEELNELLERNELDLCLTYIVPEIRWVETESLYTEQLCFAVPIKLAKRGVRGRTLPFPDIGDYPLALPTPAHGLRKLVENTAARMNVRLDVRFEIDSYRLLQDVVAKSLACTVLPLSGLLAAVKSGTLRAYPFDDASMLRTMSLARSKRRPMSKAVLAVKDLLIQTTREQIARSAFSDTCTPARSS